MIGAIGDAHDEFADDINVGAGGGVIDRLVQVVRRCVVALGQPAPAVGSARPRRAPGVVGPPRLLIRYFCGELAFLAGAVMSGAVTWNTSSANFRWLASSCSAKL